MMASSGITAFKSRFKHDRSGRARFVFQTDDGSRCQRFQNAQLTLLSRASANLSSSAWLLGSLVALEGIADAADLELAYLATPARHFWRGHWRICWTRAEQGQDARALSLVTERAASAVRALLPFSDAVAELMRFLQKEGIYPPGTNCSLDEVLRDAVVWLQYAISPVLHGHIAGRNRMTALPLSAIARDITGLPLLPAGPAEVKAEGPCPHTALSLGLEAALRFVRPIKIGAIVEVEARLASTGRTSMNIAVDVRSGDLKDGALQTNTECAVVMVAVDSEGKASEVQAFLSVGAAGTALAEETRRRLGAANAPSP